MCLGWCVCLCVCVFGAPEIEGFGCLLPLNLINNQLRERHFLQYKVRMLNKKKDMFKSHQIKNK